MKEIIAQLPQDIFQGTEMPSDEIIIYDFAAVPGSLKGKRILTKNAISLVVSGEKTMHFAEKTVYINDEEFHLLSAGNCVASINLSDKKAFRSILMFFDEHVLSSFYIKYDVLVSQLRSRYATQTEPYISIKKDEFIRNYIASLILISHTPLSKAMKQLKFEELMLYLLENHPREILAFQSQKKMKFDDLEFRKIVETNITNKLTLEELSFLCNVSLSTFKRRFLQIYGAPPNQWILNRRMEIAATLLQDHKEKPSEVFYKVGYENHSSFTQSFKQSFGITPKEYQSKKLNV